MKIKILKMSLIAFTFIYLIVLPSCNIKNKQYEVEDLNTRYRSFQMSLFICPAFDPLIRLQINATDSNRTITMYPIWEMEEYFKPFEPITCNISDKEFTHFINYLNTVNFLNIPSLDGASVDGISAYIFFTNSHNDTASISFSSPDENTIYSKLINELFDLAFSSIHSQPHMRILENACKYYHVNKGYKIINTDPYYVRFFGELKSEYQEDYSKLFAAIPNDKDIIIDISNIRNECDEFNNELYKFAFGNPNIYWIVAPKIDIYYKEFGRYNDKLNNEYQMKYLSSVVKDKNRIFESANDAYRAIFVKNPKYVHFFGNLGRIGDPMPVPDSTDK